MRLTPVVLEGAAIRLEPLGLHHIDGLCAVGIDAELWRLTTIRVPDRAAMTDYVGAALADQAAGTALPFATVWRETAQVIGSTRFGSVSTEHRRVEVGWTWLARPWQRSRANTEAKYLMLRHAFETWGCERVELKTSARNERSRVAILRIGAREEGTLRHHMINADGTHRDSVFFSILAEEWPDVRRRLEHRLT